MVITRKCYWQFLDVLRIFKKIYHSEETIALKKPIEMTQQIYNQTPLKDWKIKSTKIL